MSGRTRGAVLGSVGSVVLLVAAMSDAAPIEKAPTRPMPAPAPSIVTKPQISIAPFVEITNFQRVPPYDNTGINYQVTLHSSAAAATVQLHAVRYGNAESIAPQQVAVPAKGDATVTIKDPRLDGMNCGLSYELWLEGTGGDPTKRTASLNVACTFATSVADSLMSMTPDRRHDQETGRAFFANTVAKPFNSCNGMHVEVDFVNKSPNTGKAIEISLDETDGVSAWQGNIGNVAPGATRHVVMEGMTIHGVPGPMKLRLIDPVQSLQGKVASQSVQIQITPSCSAQSGLAPR